MAQFIKFGDHTYLNVNSIDCITYGYDTSGWHVYLYYDGQKKRYLLTKSLTRLEAQGIINQIMTGIENKETVISVYYGIQEDIGYHRH